MASLRAFVPPHLLLDLAGKRELPPAPQARRVEAALLFVDIVGFTSLTEVAQSRGREGAEEVAVAVNRVFRPSIRAIEAQRGGIASFGGDALFALFTGRGGVRRAVAAAHAISRIVARGGSGSRGGDRVPLRVSIAVHRGAVSLMHLGSGLRRHFLVAGEAVESLARLHARSERGGLVLSAATRAAADPDRGAPPPAPWERLRVPSGHVAAYLPPRLVPALVRNLEDHRRVVVLFVETRSRSARMLGSFFAALSGALDTYGGVLLKTDLSVHGTKWLCVFGMPAEHEDDFERAARAACDLWRRLPPGLAARGGIQGGTVVSIGVGTRSRRSLDVLGDVVNSAARICGAAAWGELLVSDAVLSRLSGAVARDRGLHRVAGKAEVLRLHALKSMDGRRRSSSEAPMVGRQRETRLVSRLLATTARGRGGLLAIEGEAGIGKTVLAGEALRQARRRGFRTLQGRALPFGARAFQPLVELLEAAFATADGATVRWEGALRDAGLGAMERGALLPILEPERGGDGSLVDGGSIRRARTMALRALFARLARNQPLLVVLDDIQHADADTWEGIRAVGQLAKEAPLVVLVLGRAGGVPANLVERHTLGRLPARDVVAMLQGELGAGSAKAAREVARRSRGNPYFARELARHLRETGAGEGRRSSPAAATAELPSSVSALVGARLDRLSLGARRLAEWAAVVGAPFRRERAREALPEEPGALAALDELEGAGLLARQGAELQLSPPLVRDALYDRILASRRARLHRRVARALEARGSAPASTASTLAYHWERGRRPARALPHLREASRAAIARHTYDEAAAHLSKLLQLGGGRGADAVKLRTQLGLSLFRAGHLEGSSRELQRARLLAARRGDPHGESQALRHLGLNACHAGDRRRVEAILRRSKALASGASPRLRALAAEAIATLEVWRQRPDAARPWIEMGLARARRLRDPVRVVSLLGFLALTERARGEVATAEKLGRAVVAEHRRLRNQRGVCIALGNLAVIVGERGRSAAAVRLMERALAIAAELGDRWTEAYFGVGFAVLLVRLGRTREARRRLRRDLLTLHEIGDRYQERVAWANVALLEEHRGRHDLAADARREALRLARESGDPVREAELLAITGVALARRGRWSRGEALARRGQRELLRLGAHVEAAAVSSGLAAAHVEAGRAEKAIALAAGALETFAKARHGFELGNLLVWRSRAHLALSDARAARADATAAIAALSRVGVRCELVLAHVARAEACRALGLGARRDEERARALLAALDPDEHPAERDAVAALRRRTPPDPGGRAPR